MQQQETSRNGRGKAWLVLAGLLLGAMPLTAPAQQAQPAPAATTPVGPSEAYAGAVSKALGALDKADKSGQAKLKAARTPQQQRAAAKSLAKAFHGAGRTLARQDLSPADRGVNGLLVKALRQTGGGYDDAASAASKKSKAAFSKASGKIADGREAVANALDGLKAAGYDVAS